MYKKGFVKLKCRDLYKYYIENLDEIEKNNGYNITYSVFYKTISKINDRIMNHIVLDRDSYTIPVIRFELSVKKRKTINGIKTYNDGNSARFGPVDWKSTKDLWKVDEDARKNKKLIFHLNHHTDGYMYFIDVKHQLKCIRNTMFEFKAVRKYRRLLAKQLLGGHGLDAYVANRRSVPIKYKNVKSVKYI